MMIGTYKRKLEMKKNNLNDADIFMQTPHI